MESIGLDYNRFKGRPSEGIRFVIKKNKDELFQNVIQDLSSKDLKLENRIRILTELYNYILCCEDGIASHMESIFRVLYKYIDDDSKDVQAVILKIAYAVSFFISPDVVFPYFLGTVFSRDSAAETTIRASLKHGLKILNELIRGANKETLGTHIKSLVSILGTHEFDTSDSSVVMEQLLNLAELIMDSGKGLCKEFRSELFHAILNIAASSGGAYQLVITKYFEKLSNYCELKSTQELYTLELPKQLISLEKESEKWDKTSVRRFAFKILVANAKESMEDYWKPVTTILKNCTQRTKDSELRRDIINFLEFIIDTYCDMATLAENSPDILTSVLIPCCEWNPGKEFANIRMTAINCIRKSIEKALLEKSLFFSHYKDVLAALKSCLEDEWNGDLRLSSCVLLKAIMIFLSDNLGGMIIL